MDDNFLKYKNTNLFDKAAWHVSGKRDKTFQGYSYVDTHVFIICFDTSYFYLSGLSFLDYLGRICFHNNQYFWTRFESLIISTVLKQIFFIKVLPLNLIADQCR